LTDCRFHFDVNTASFSVDSLLNKDFTKGKEDDAVLVLNALFSQLQEKTMHLKPGTVHRHPRSAVDAAVLCEKTMVPAVGGGYLLVPAMAEKKEKEKDDEPKDESNKPKDEPKDEPKEEEEEDEEEDEWIDLSDLSLEENSMSMTMAATTPPTSEKEEDEKEDFLDFW
jgi:flagellar biosynthesis/type III secretory pathway M-ring protein FliF/YscJ